MTSGETHIAERLVVLVLPLTTLVIWPFGLIDPINLPKFWVLSSIGCGLSGLLVFKLKKFWKKENRMVISSSILFVFSLLLSVIFTKSPLTQQLFGTQGRNTGFLTYLSLIAIFLTTVFYFNYLSRRFWLQILSLCFGLNLIYAIFQSAGFDPLSSKVDSSYTPVIGTFGNPNFISAFLGMGFGLFFSYMLNSATQLKTKLIISLCLPVAIYAIHKSDSQQGFIVALVTSFTSAFIYLTKSKLNRFLVNAIFFVSVIGGVTAVLGMLQKGPLTGILYKESVTFRGDYWRAGINMLKNHLFFGVGLDSYGDWYRSLRTVEATLRRGPDIVSNSAHNVFIDLAATAGIFALIFYLLIVFIGFQSAFRYLKRSSSFDPFFTSIFSIWIGYLAQSVISINNIGLAIWGWIPPGIIIAIEKFHDYSNSVPHQSNKRNQSNDFSWIGLALGALLGAIIGFLPVKAESDFRSALDSQQSNQIFSKVQSWATTSEKLNYAIDIFRQNKMDKQVKDLSLYAVSRFPRDYFAWKALYELESNTKVDRDKALIVLRNLDPNNPDLKKLGK